MTFTGATASCTLKPELFNVMRCILLADLPVDPIISYWQECLISIAANTMQRHDQIIHREDCRKKLMPSVMNKLHAIDKENIELFISILKYADTKKVEAVRRTIDISVSCTEYFIMSIL